MNLEAFEDELTCPVCLMLFTDPRTLPCGNSHNVCIECARGLWRNQQPSAYGSTIQCPVCRQSCDIGGNVEKLPLNLALRNMVEKLEAAQKGLAIKKTPSKKRMACDVCEKAPACMECVTCVVKYCQNCLETCHPKERDVFKAHVVAPIETVTSRDCENHEDQPLAFFCTQCGVPVCAHCLLMGGHVEHPRVSLHSAVEQKQKALAETVGALKMKRAVVLDFTTKADAALEKMKGQCCEMRARVEAECLELEMLTRKLHSKLINEIDAQEKEKGAVLMQQVEGQRQKLTVWGAMLDRADQVVNDEDKAAYLDIHTHKLEKQMRDAVAASTATPLLTFSLPQLTLNLAPLRDAVSSMHFQENLVPPASTDLTSPEGTRNSLLITWKCEAREDRPNTFILQRALFGDGRTSDEWEEVYRGPSRTTTDADLDPQTSYRYRVQALNSSGKGEWSEVAILTTGTPKPPTDLTLLSASAAALQLAWTGDPSIRSRHCSYTLEMNRADSADGELGGDWEEAYCGPSRTFTVKALKPEESYRFRVCAANASGKGGYGPTVQFSTTAEGGDSEGSLRGGGVGLFVAGEDDENEDLLEDENRNLDVSVVEPAMNAPSIHIEPEGLVGENAQGGEGNAGDGEGEGEGEGEGNEAGERQGGRQPSPSDSSGGGQGVQPSATKAAAAPTP